METIVKEIEKVIEKIRPYLNRDGGDCRFVRYEDGVVYIELLGACSNCGSSDVTLKQGIEAILIEEVPGVIAVEKAE